jgi:hypothetical protein
MSTLRRPYRITTVGTGKSMEPSMRYLARDTGWMSQSGKRGFDSHDRMKERAGYSHFSVSKGSVGRSNAAEDLGEDTCRW